METLTVELKFVRESNACVDGIDSRGHARWFDKTKIGGYRVDGDKLFVEVDRREWERRMSRIPVIKPTRQAAKKKVKRKCLVCGHPFSDQPQMRICQPCKKTANWKTGDEYQYAG